MKDFLILGGIALLIFYGCQSKLEDRTDYKKGYEGGYNNGLIDGDADTCQKIERFKDSIHSALQNERICP